jgi:hypothetical protein
LLTVELGNCLNEDLSAVTGARLFANDVNIPNDFKGIS